MKFSAYAALLLPFALLLVLIAAVIVTPRLDSRTTRPSVAAAAATVTNLAETQVVAYDGPLASAPALAAYRAGQGAGGRHKPFSLRMPYFSFANDFDLLPGR